MPDLKFDARVNTKPAEKDLGGLGKFASKFSTDLVTKFFGTQAIIQAATRAAQATVSVFDAALKQSLSAGKLGLTVEAFEQISRFAELTGFSVEKVAKKLAEGGAEARRLQAIMDQITPKSGVSGAASQSAAGVDLIVREFLLGAKGALTKFLVGTFSLGMKEVAMGTEAIGAAKQVFKNIWAGGLKGIVGRGEHPIDTVVKTFFDSLRKSFTDPTTSVASMKALLQGQGMSAAQAMEEAKRLLEPSKFRLQPPTALEMGDNAKAGRFNLLSGVSSANFQRDLLNYTREIEEHLRQIRVQQWTTPGASMPIIPGYGP